MVAPSQKERPQRFLRSQINFNSLDHVGHGTKVVDKNQVIDDRYKKEVSACLNCSVVLSYMHTHTCSMHTRSTCTCTNVCGMLPQALGTLAS